MEFIELTSSPEALNSLGEMFGLQKVKPKKTKSTKEVLINQLGKISKLSKRAEKKLKKLKLDLELINTYKSRTQELLVTSKEIISKLETGDDIDVKEDIETP